MSVTGRVINYIRPKTVQNWLKKKILANVLSRYESPQSGEAVGARLMAWAADKLFCRWHCLFFSGNHIKGLVVVFGDGFSRTV